LKWEKTNSKGTDAVYKSANKFVNQIFRIIRGYEKTHQPFEVLAVFVHFMSPQALLVHLKYAFDVSQVLKARGMVDQV
jgi:hypothetical protein